MSFPSTVYTDNESAASGLVNNAALKGLDVSGLNPIAQIQSTIANILLDAPGDSVELSDIEGYGADGGYLRSNGSGWVRTSGVDPADLSSVVSGAKGGTGVANTGKTITLGGNLVTSGAFALTLTTTATTNVTLPTSGTLATTAGNVATATALATPRTINGTAFDGTANITVTAAAGTLTGTTLNATVVTSSLTSTGVLAGLKVASRTTTTASETATISDGTILCDATSNAVTVNLPLASTATGLILNIKKIDSSGNAVTIDGNGSETIDGATTKATSTQWTAFQIQCNGTTWSIL